jgi:transcriptional regulator with XRE-family HTH domain
MGSGSGRVKTPVDTEGPIVENSVTGSDFRGRMEKALLQLSNVLGRNAKYRDVVRLLSEYLGKPVSDKTVSRYFNGRIPREREVLLGLAKVMHVDPGWLAFGEDSAAPSPRSGNTLGYHREPLQGEREREQREPTNGHGGHGVNAVQELPE